MDTYFLDVFQKEDKLFYGNLNLKEDPSFNNIGGLSSIKELEEFAHDMLIHSFVTCICSNEPLPKQKNSSKKDNRILIKFSESERIAIETYNLFCSLDITMRYLAFKIFYVSVDSAYDILCPDIPMKEKDRLYYQRKLREYTDSNQEN